MNETMNKFNEKQKRKEIDQNNIRWAKDLFGERDNVNGSKYLEVKKKYIELLFK